jgi:hypothetical protein
LAYRKNCQNTDADYGGDNDNGYGDNSSDPTSKPSLRTSVPTTNAHTQSDIMSATREKVVSSISNKSESSTAVGNTTTTNIQCKEDNSLTGIPYIL